ncbi:MAG: 2,5-diamino-6-(ribosylamino)-4(3H)-pyrimidinone 5'-phosphate reductase [Candidatus Lokiarchaeota archaeon]|nr:2,5-diamino-6-(ribosylamino)-4(3H)-pyrimidinone 5'-phosphate reductase [Candidatus Lokiarchaeota archaeon]MBD3198732.1 2,5-diamino-6-(ribosylamino)-4(3H)-pyrimidinone 5'-phosphate reductase [Candidatus Lokiarchaeota archaeon]
MAKRHMKENKRPYIILSAAMTIDGKIATRMGDPELSDEDDWKTVHKLRTEVDAIMVGKGTILNDNPKLHIKYYDHDGYYRIVADSNLSISLDSKVIRFKPDIYPTCILATENANERRIKQFEDKNVKVIKAGNGKRVNLYEAILKLYDIGIHSILLEGGGTLNWSMFKHNLVDEIRLTIAPWVIGGSNSPTLVDGIGFEKMRMGLRYKLSNLKQRNNYVILNYYRGDANER